VIKIDKRIPIPSKQRCGPYPGCCKYPFRRMKVCDSFFVACEDDPRERDAAGKRIRASLRTLSIPIVITIRGVVGGVRCWRTE